MNGQFTVFMSMGREPMVSQDEYAPVPFQSQVHPSITFARLSGNEGKVAYVFFQHAINAGGWQKISQQQAKQIWHSKFPNEDWRNFIRQVFSLANAGYIHVWFDTSDDELYFIPEPDLSKLKFD